VGGEDQLKALVRFAFSLQNTADKSVLTVDGVLAQTMGNVKRLVETLPQEGLLRNKAWKDLEPLVKEELDRYGKQLGKALVRGDSQAAPDMRDYAVREFEHGGADLPEAVRVRNQPVPGSVEMALRSKVNTMTLDKMFNVSGKAKGEAPILKALFKTVDTRVRGGIIRGETTQTIADLMATDVVTAGIPGVKLTAPVAKQIQSQAMTIARTATQDMARQVKAQVYEQNKAATEGMVWQWTTALDSRTCETCAPMDGRRWEQDTTPGPPDWPIHPNCRCQALLIDAEDDFWNGREVTAQQIRPVEQGAYEGGYKTPITINGEKFYRKAITVTSDTGRPRYSDVLAKWATDSSTSLNEALGPSRARWFKAQYQKMNADPQRILQAMLTQKPAGQQTFISLDALQKKSLDFKPKAKPKPKPKPAAAKPKPKPKSPTQASNAGKYVEEHQFSNGKAKITPATVKSSFDELVKGDSQSAKNFAQMMQFQEKNNLSVIWSGGREKMPADYNFWTKSEAFKSSQKSAIARGKRTIPKNKREAELAEISNRYNERLMRNLDEGYFGSVTQSLGKLKSGEAGHTANSFGAIVVRQGSHQVGINAARAERIRAATRETVRSAADGRPKYVTYQDLMKKGSVKAPEDWLMTYVHEMGHQVHYAAGVPEFRDYLPKELLQRTVGNNLSAIEALGEVKKKTWTPSKYGGSNEYERFAETFVQYVFAPDELQKASPAAFKWVQDAIEKGLK